METGTKHLLIITGAVLATVIVSTCALYGAFQLGAANERFNSDYNYKRLVLAIRDTPQDSLAREKSIEIMLNSPSNRAAADEGQALLGGERISVNSRPFADDK